MERIAVFAALRWECVPVLRQMRRVSRERTGGFTIWRGSTPRYEVVLVKTGMGIEQAAAAARTVSGGGTFALFMSTGCAGALSADLAPGDVTVATAVVSDSSDDHLDTHPEHRDAARRAAERAALRAATGPILCSARALMTAEDKRLGAAQHGAIAVDMEGAPIAAEAARRHIPFVAVRAILDTADTELKHMGRFIEPHTGAVKPMALAGYLATHPGALADLLALQRMMRAAQTSLERFFTVWFSTLDS